MESDKIIESILNDFNSFNIDDIPNIDLYMDQVTTYLNNKFEGSKRNDDDKLLTKTMINNYAKSRLLPWQMHWANLICRWKIPIRPP